MKRLGQYFTKNIILQEKVYEFVKNNPDNILEPSVGRGDLVDYYLSKKPETKFDMYEIDDSIQLLAGLSKRDVIYTDFLEQKINKKYSTIIGNPPYVKSSRGNLYLEFIEKCYKLLGVDGELVFIIPSNFFKLTSARKLLIEMLNKGTFTHIHHFNDEKLFESASVDVIVFRYQKDNHCNIVNYNGEKKNIINNDGMITFIDEIIEGSEFSEYFNVFVGMVSAAEHIFKSSKLGNTRLLVSEDKFENYIIIHEFPSNNRDIDSHLLKYKDKLLQRKIKKFDEDNWFEWGALRNFVKITPLLGIDCIYIHNLTRQNKISFIGKVSYFGGNLLILIPKVNINLKKVSEYLNSDTFKKNFIFSGRFSIGHRQLCKSIIPNEHLT